MAHENRIFLGIDGGGTGCRVVLCDEEVNLLGSGVAGAANIMSNFDGAIASILEASHTALRNAEIDAGELHRIPAFLGLAGANSGEAVARLREKLPFANSVIETDARISLEGAIGSEDGAVAIIGTGTVYIYRIDGVVRTAGGWGFSVGDLASGAWLGRRLLQEALLCHDGVHAHSQLTRQVMSDFENDPHKVMEYAHSALPGEFGTYAPMIFGFAKRGDTIGEMIVGEAISHIEETLASIVKDDGSPLCMLGGLGPVYGEMLDTKYGKRLRTPIADAVTGAAQLAVKTFSDQEAHHGH
ncbi:MAG: BadF/BadG/BcrA/BcrD ATPase family protein [Rhizobiaceae bacterium]